jgi:methionyl-tRNA synthetase
VQVFQSLNTLLQPFTPQISKKVQDLLNQTDLKYSNIFKPNIDEINEYSHIIKRLDIKEVNKLVDSL